MRTEDTWPSNCIGYTAFALRGSAEFENRVEHRLRCTECTMRHMWPKQNYAIRGPHGTVACAASALFRWQLKTPWGLPIVFDFMALDSHMRPGFLAWVLGMHTGGSQTSLVPKLLGDPRSPQFSNYLLLLIMDLPRFIHSKNDNQDSYIYSHN